MSKRHATKPKKRKPRLVAQPNQATAKLPTLEMVCASPDKFLGQLDIAALNLMCAGGLPGAENINFDRMHDWLDQAARMVEYQTRRHWYRFLASPSTYNKSPGYFCCYFLLQVLQEDFGVRYNPARISDPKFQDPKCHNPDFKDSRDLFIHGIIDGPGGTCCSMPVLYVAVGRRLGYPLFLVHTRGHLFFRWDDPRGERLGLPERFNVEGAGEGIHSYPDEHYRTWPEPWSEAEKVNDWYLKTSSSVEDLASFLSTRGECLIDNGRRAEAIQAYQWVCGLLPDNVPYRSRLAGLLRQNQQLHQDIAEMLMFERIARDQKKSRLLAGPQSPRTTLPSSHGIHCQCMECQNIKVQSAVPRNAPGHSEYCNCSVCAQHRGAIVAQQNPPPHGPSCQCMACRQARERMSAPRTMPGHPPGCGCVMCQQRNSGMGRIPGVISPWGF